MLVEQSAPLPQIMLVEQSVPLPQMMLSLQIAENAPAEPQMIDVPQMPEAPPINALLPEKAAPEPTNWFAPYTTGPDHADDVPHTAERSLDNVTLPETAS
jgi:hypothetical protein